MKRERKTLVQLFVPISLELLFFMMAAALCAGNCYLLPLDTVPLITYAKGYYSMTDMAKSTLFLQIAMVILSAIWLPIIGGLF